MNKICTDIKQSKKLVELGIDINSADMLWTYDFMINDINGLNVISEYLKPEENDIPAWSLVALLDILPHGKALIHDKGNRGYKCICNNIDTYFHDNPIDACYEMILKLHERNLL